MTATHEDDSYKVDGAELANIKIMGMVAAIEEHSTNFNFKVNDGTGVMDCKQWIDRDTRAQSKLTGFNILFRRQICFVTFSAAFSRRFEGWGIGSSGWKFARIRWKGSFVSF